MPITLRGTKGSALTHAELDANFSTLQADIAAVTGSNFNGDYNNLTNKPTVPQQLNDLSDVTISPPTNGEVLQYNGSTFVNSTISYAEVTNTPVLATVASTGQLTSLTDVATPTATDDGFVLFYEYATNSFKWKAAGSGGGGGLASVVQDTTPQLGGDLDTNGNNIIFSGNTKAQFGAAQDLGIWHNGAHSIIRETGTGSLYLQSDNNVILSTDSGTKKMVKGVGSGEVVLYHNDVQKLETSADGVKVTGKILYSNVYSNLVDLPDANTYHGMFAHVHATGAGYFAHGGNWIQLANYQDLSAYQTTGGLGGNIDLHLNQSNPTAGFVLSWNGSDYAWTAPGGTTVVPTQSTAPTGASDGDLWWDDVGGKLKIYYDDGVSQQWVDASPAGGSGSGGGATNVASLTDVDSVDTVASGDFLLYDGSSSEYKFVAFEPEVNQLIDNRTGSSGHIATQSQYAGTITTDPTDPTDTSHHVLGNTGSASVHQASTAWYYGDVVSDPANPTTSVLLDVDQQRWHGSVETDNIALGSGGNFNAQPGATLDLQGTTIHFGSATIAGGNAFNPVINNHLWSGATAPTDGYVLSWDASALSGAGDYAWIANTGGSGLANVVDDTTPELGGDLVTGTNRLKFSSAGGSMLDFTVTQYSVANNTVLSSVGSINLFLDSASADTSGDTAFRIFDTTDPDGTVTEANNIFKITDTGDIEVKGLLTAQTDSVNPNGNNISIKAGQATALNSTGGFVNINGGAGALQDGDVYIAQSLPSGLGNNLVMGNGTNDALLNFNNITIQGQPAFSNNVTMAAGVQERYVPLVGQGPGNVPYDAAFGQVMIHDTPTADHVADIVNLLVSPQNATNVTIMLKNGPAPTIIQSVLFNGTAPASFQWQGGTPPTGNANATDVYSFTVYDDGFGIHVLGQMVSFA